MTVLSGAQIQQVWINAGGNPQSAPMAAAIALAESGGNPGAVNSNTNGSTDRGLWQINSVHGAQSTFDLTANARAAVAISNNGRSWQPWSTFGNGAYRKFLNGFAPSGGAVGSTNAGVTKAASLPGTGGTPLDPTFWSHIADTLLNWFYYGGMLVGGSLMVILGILALFRSTGGGAVVSKVAKVAMLA